MTRPLSRPMPMLVPSRSGRLVTAPRTWYSPRTSLIERLIPLIPRLRAHLVRYHGILGPAAEGRAKVVPRFAPPELRRSAASEVPRELDPSGMPRLGRLPWAVLLKRVFLVDVLECPKCKGRMTILAAVTAPASVRRVLDHLGLPSEAPRLWAARPPPQRELAAGREPPDDFYPNPPGHDAANATLIWPMLKRQALQ